MTRPQPTADSDDGGDDEEDGGGDMDEEGGVLVDVPEPPPQGPALEAVRGGRGSCIAAAAAPVVVHGRHRVRCL